MAIDEYEVAVRVWTERGWYDETARDYLLGRAASMAERAAVCRDEARAYRVDGPARITGGIVEEECRRLEGEADAHEARAAKLDDEARRTDANDRACHRRGRYEAERLAEIDRLRWAISDAIDAHRARSASRARLAHLASPSGIDEARAADVDRDARLDRRLAGRIAEIRGRADAERATATAIRARVERIRATTVADCVREADRLDAVARRLADDATALRGLVEASPLRCGPDVSVGRRSHGWLWRLGQDDIESPRARRLQREARWRARLDAIAHAG